MAKKKKNNGAFLGIPLFSGKKKPKRVTRAQRQAIVARRKLVFGIAASIILCAMAAVGFILLEDRYVDDSPRIGKLYMPGRPEWYNDKLDNLITQVLGGSEFTIEAGKARYIAERLESLSWLSDVRVDTGSDRLTVYANYRRPIAIVTLAGRKSYLDSKMTVMEYVPLGELKIVKIEGLESVSIAAPGEVWHADDAAAAVTLIDLLMRMDQKSSPNRPLLNEIRAVDVSNYNGRKSLNADVPHIVLYANDGTEIQWGAAVGQSARYFEASDTEKLGQLYSDYKEYGTVQGRSGEIFKYLDLRVPQEQVPLP